MSIVYYAVTPSRCAETGDCGESNTPCTPKPGNCVYYSGDFLSGPVIQNGDNFNTVTVKLTNYINSLLSGGGTSIVNGTNVGYGNQVFKDKVGTNLRFRTITAGSNITIWQSDDEIQISATTSGSSETAINLGSQVEVFKQKAGDEFQFRTLMGQDLIQVSQVGDNVLVRHNNKDYFSLVSNGVRVYPAGTYIEKIIIYPGATMSSFKIGSTPGNDDIVIDQPIAGLQHTTILVEKYFQAGVTFYIEGINSNTDFKVLLEKL